MRLCQIASSVTDLRRAHAWYEKLGFLPAGGTNLFAGPIATMVQGVPRAASTCWWLVDRQDQLQIELFEFRSPPVRRMPADWRPNDVGYSMLGIHVGDLDATLGRLAEDGTEPLSESLGDAGARRVCVRDPDGVLVELMEEDPRAPRPRERPRPDAPAVRSVTLSVPSLERSRRVFEDVLGLKPAEGVGLHAPEHEALWGLEGAKRESALLWADDMLVELVEYLDPRGRDWPDGYRISDQGLLNIAFGFRDREEFERAYRRCIDSGLIANCPPVRLGAWSVVYVNDADGFSIELLHAEPWYEGQMGFSPRSRPRFAPFVGRAAASPDGRFAKALVTGATGGIGSELCRLLAADGTRLVLLDRDQGPLGAFAAGLEGSAEIATSAVDFTNLEALDGAIEEIAAEHPDLDALFVVAGLDRAQSMLDFDWRQARDDFAVNALSSLVLLSRLAPGMADRGGGHVTAIASLAALVGTPYEAAYSGSKAALVNIVESARAELGPRGLTFTTVFPGFVDTEMFRQNAFRHTYSIPARDAAERIYRASLDRRPELAFPGREYAKAGVARLVPARLRDRLTRQAMRPREDPRD
ncbi:MAG TPA: SDR family NAD(P)-dependent oxidoreductase [Solirubrobacterales bacterium]|nr:SDR family NAD(P)-dependent oxidoreductase [Solirubrobacterales bacterium]